MSEFLANVDKFDLSRHAVIEASAGTGKTYTIERLVLRLLTDDFQRKDHGVGLFS